MAEEKKEKAVDIRKKYQDANKGLDVFDPVDNMTLQMPTSSERSFLSKRDMFGIKGRTKGPCETLIKFLLPNGDFALPGDTFDPVEERMPAMTYRRLLAKKYITPGGEKVETKLLDLSKVKTK